MKIIEQTHEESNAYSLFVYAIRSQVTRDYYLRRLKIFNYINLELEKTMEQRCNCFADIDEIKKKFIENISCFVL